MPRLGEVNAMKIAWFLIGFIILLLPGVAQAACRVAEGATFCQNGMIWKCERCSSQLCEIMTGKSCGKVVDPKVEAEFLRRAAKFNTECPGVGERSQPAKFQACKAEKTRLTQEDNRLHGGR
jgi:hypothetical protein